MNIRILGAGFTGLALTYYALKEGYEVTLYDGGPGASHVAAGLLHPFVGMRCQLNRFGWEGMKATLKLMEEVEYEPLKKGIHRIKNDFFIRSGVQVNCLKYLQKLKLACHQATIIEGKGEPDSEVPTIIAHGIPPLEAIKGHLLKIDWKHDVPLIGEVYLTTNGWMGSTYERNFTSAAPDIEVAKKLILPRAQAHFPWLNEEHILDCQAGIRYASKDHMPVMKKLENNLYILSGMGSKGLLYHALYSRRFLKEILGADNRCSLTATGF